MGDIGLCFTGCPLKDRLIYFVTLSHYFYFARITGSGQTGIMIKRYIIEFVPKKNQKVIGDKLYIFACLFVPVPPAVLVAPVLVAVAALGEAQQPRVAGRQRDDLQSASSSKTSVARIGLDGHEEN